MAVSQIPLGMNARNFLYIKRYNSKAAKQVADNKILTKKLLLQHQIPTPKLLAIFPNRKAVKAFDWQLPEDGFVIKPARGLAGEGILVITKWHKTHGRRNNGQIITRQELVTHLLDIMDGAYSLQNLPDIAFAEQLIRMHPFLKKYVPLGLPDIRLIVFNQIQVMSMLRLPTNKSQGKANLNQGAIGVGIDMSTGITTTAFAKHKGRITYLPGTKTKLCGIKLPFWDEILLMASQAQKASALGFAGVDIVIDAKSGPLVIEINARPGLEIQNVNQASLRTRLERIEHMPPVSPERGVQVAKSLFASPFSDRVKIKPIYLEPFVKLNIGKPVVMQVLAAVNPLQLNSQIDLKLVEKLSQINPHLVIEEQHLKLNFQLKNRSLVGKFKIMPNLPYPLMLGRRELKNVRIKTELSNDTKQLLKQPDQWVTPVAPTTQQLESDS